MLPWPARVLRALVVLAVVVVVAGTVGVLVGAPAVGRIDDETLARSVRDEVRGNSYPGLPACRGSGCATLRQQLDLGSDPAGRFDGHIGG